MVVRENSLTRGNGDLDLDRDLQKFHKQQNLNPQVPLSNLIQQPWCLSNVTVLQTQER